MKTRILSISVTVIVLACGTCSSGAQTLTPDLKVVPEGKGWKGSIGATKLIEKDGAPAIEFNKTEDELKKLNLPTGANVVWLDGFEFSAGTIEFDAKGKSTPPQSSFVGLRRLLCCLPD